METVPDAGLTRVPEFADDRSLDRFLKICVLKDDERGVSTEFHGHFLHCSSGKFGQHFPDACAPGEADLLDNGVRGQFRSRLSIFCGDDMDAVGGDARFDCQLGECQTRIRCLTRWLDDDRATGRECRRNLSSNHGRRKVPWCDDSAHSDGLFECENGGVGKRRRNDVAINSRCFFTEPLDESCSVDNLPFRLCKCLSILQTQNFGHCKVRTTSSSDGEGIQSSRFWWTRSNHFRR